jgi:hypothetical protein
MGHHDSSRAKYWDETYEMKAKEADYLLKIRVEFDKSRVVIDT